MPELISSTTSTILTSDNTTMAITNYSEYTCDLAVVITSSNIAMAVEYVEIMLCAFSIFINAILMHTLQSVSAMDQFVKSSVMMISFANIIFAIMPLYQDVSTVVASVLLNDPCKMRVSFLISD